jgi:hypothetical protein
MILDLSNTLAAAVSAVSSSAYPGVVAGHFFVRRKSGLELIGDFLGDLAIETKNRAVLSRRSFAETDDHSARRFVVAAAL